MVQIKLAEADDEVGDLIHDGTRWRATGKGKELLREIGDGVYFNPLTGEPLTLDPQEMAEQLPRIFDNHAFAAGLVSTRTKHLQGQHDQSTHGGRGGGLPPVEELENNPIMQRLTDHYENRTLGRHTPTNGDATLHEVATAQGFTAKPKVVSDADLDAYIKENGTTEMFRGTTGVRDGDKFEHGSKFADATRHAEPEDMYYGTGAYGNGLYAATGKSEEALDHARRLAHGYAGFTDGGVIRFTMDKDSRFITHDEMDAYTAKAESYFRQKAEDEGYGSPVGDRYRAMRRVIGDDYGWTATMLGYDGILTRGAEQTEYVVILNRGRMIISDTNDPRPSPDF